MRMNLIFIQLNDLYYPNLWSGSSSTHAPLVHKNNNLWSPTCTSQNDPATSSKKWRCCPRLDWTPLLRVWFLWTLTRAWLSLEIKYTTLELLRWRSRWPTTILGTGTTLRISMWTNGPVPFLSLSRPCHSYNIDFYDPICLAKSWIWEISILLFSVLVE